MNFIKSISTFPVIFAVFILLITLQLSASPFTEFDGVILGDKVNIRSDASVKAKVAGSAVNGTPIRILSSQDPVTLPGINGEFPWIEIETAKVKTGWVFGKFIYSLAQDTSNWYSEGTPLKSHITDPELITIQGKKYYPGVVSARCYPEKTGIDTEDPGECALPFLYQKDTGKILLFVRPAEYCKGRIPYHTKKQFIEGDRVGGILRLVDFNPFANEQIQEIRIPPEGGLQLLISTSGNGFSGLYNLSGKIIGDVVKITECKMEQWDEVK
jgi:hypothetical protein